MTHTPSNTNSASSGKNRRMSIIRLFNGKTKTSGSVEPIEDSSAPQVPGIPAHYRHSVASPMAAMQSQMMRERRKSIAAMTDASGRSQSLDMKHPEMTDKMREFDELLQKRRGSTIRISLTPSLLQEP
jgi:hypothetical protein